MIICSVTLIVPIQMVIVWNYLSLNNNLNVDDTGNTFIGVLNGRYKVYVDHTQQLRAKQYYVVGYKGTSYDVIIFYYVLQMVRAVGQDTLHKNWIQN